MLWVRSRCVSYDFVGLHSTLDLPELNTKENSCVREDLQICLPENLPGYNIDRISTVADQFFHHNNLQHAKHRLVVKLRISI